MAKIQYGVKPDIFKKSPWRLQWHSILSCAAARVCSFLVGIRGGHADGVTPPSFEVERDQRYAGLCG